MRYLVMTTMLLAFAIGATGCAGSLHGPARTDDTGMAQVIARRFAADQRLCPFAISVAVHNRTAYLQGKVASEADRHLAAKLATDAGAAQIEDHLIIDPAAGEAGMC